MTSSLALAKPRIILEKRHTHCLQFSPYFSNKFACATGQFYGLVGSGSLAIITLTDAQPVIELFPWSDSLFSLAWSEKNENMIVTGSGDGSLQIYDIHNAKGPLKVLRAHSQEVSSVSWNQYRLLSHLFLTASWDRSINVWNGETLQALSVLPNSHSSLIYEVKPSPLVNGLFASVSADSLVKLWSMNSAQKTVNAWLGHENAEILSVDWCKYDEYTLATSGTDGLIKVWDLRSTQSPVCVLSGHQYAVRRIQFSPHQSSLFMSASYDFTVRLWDYTKHSHPLQTYNHHTEFVCGLDFNIHIPYQVASGSWDESVVVWHVGE